MAPVQFGNYQIMRKIGAGGMAQVFEAQRVGLEGFSRRVALKCILPEMTRDHRFVEMFVNEARLGSQLHHPNIVEIQDFNKVNDIYYIAMEFVEGVDLGDIISRFRSEEREFPPGLVIEIMLQALDGLGYAHEAMTDDGELMSIIHRDIKPSNLLLTRRGTVKIADFGIAKAATNAYQTRTSEVTKGSLAYMAPEQITRESPVSAGSDLFSLGAVLFEMLSLRALFDGENMPSIMFKVAQVEIERDLSELEALYPDFIPVLRNSLARDVSDRYHTAEEMAAELRRLKELYPAEMTIHQLVAEYIQAPKEEKEDDWVGENTASLLGFSSLSGEETPNLATLDPGQVEGFTSDPNFGQRPAQYEPDAQDEMSAGEDASLPPTPAATPRRSLAPLLIGLAVLVAIVGLGAVFLLGNRPSVLVVSSIPPGAQILVDGQLQTRIDSGKPEPVVTPAKVRLPKGGLAAIELRKDGYDPFSMRLEYVDGEQQELAPTLAKEKLVGSLEITSIPSGATIELNGKVLDEKTPTRLDNIAAGVRYEVRLTLEGYSPTAGQVEVQKGTTAIFASTLIAPRPQVEAPAHTAKRPPRANSSHNEPTGSSGSNRRPPTVRQQPKSEPPAEPVVESGPPGTLVVSSVPPDCVVYVDHVKRGNAPVSMELPPGSHKVRLQRFDGTTAKEFSVRIVSKQETTKVWDLDGNQFISE